MRRYFISNIASSNLDNNPYLPFVAKTHEKDSIPFRYRILYLEDFNRKMIGINVETYPAMWIFWSALVWIEEIANFFDYRLYKLLVALNGNKDFIPSNEMAGNCFRIVSYFIKAQCQNLTQS